MAYQQQQQSFVVIYPQGIAWRSAPNYNARITNIQGSVANTVLSGPVLQGQDGIQYLQVGSYFLPLTSPQGQQLVVPQQMQTQLNNDIRRVQQSYAQPQQTQVVYAQPQQTQVVYAQPGYAQPGYNQYGGHCYMDKKMMKKQGKMYKHKKNKGFKIKLF